MAHYSIAQCPLRLVKFSEKAAKVLLKLQKKTGKIPVLVYSGMSGISTATAISLAHAKLDRRAKLEMIYVRKKDEKSNGDRLEMSSTDYYSHEDFYPIFVDDFVCSGKTFKYCYEQIKNLGLTWTLSKNVLLSGARESGFNANYLNKNSIITSIIKTQQRKDSKPKAKPKAKKKMTSMLVVPEYKIPMKGTGTDLTNWYQSGYNASS